MSELCVIILLMGAELALDRPMGWLSWGTTWRMLGVVMPLCILALTLLGLWVLGLGLGATLLVAAALAPTDLVLDSEVQVGAPAREDTEADREVRYVLGSPPRQASMTALRSRSCTWQSVSAWLRS